MNKPSRVILLILAILIPINLVRGIWVLQQSWSNTYQTIGAMIFSAILWVVSLYFLLQDKLQLPPRSAERSKWLFVGIACAAMVVSGMFIMTIDPNEWIKGVLAIGFFGFGFVVAARQLLKA
jgi:hypothetical protein